jgi:hypothetical protein
VSRRLRPSKADRKPVTRRYVARVVERARQDIVRAIVVSERVHSELEHEHPARNVEPVSAERLASVMDWGASASSRSV